MGFRFRKSINFGGGFKINLSKSGIGYSWGTKGVRFTKTAKGNKRTTLSIPGTGLSHVSETSKRKNRRKSTSKAIMRSTSSTNKTNNHFQTGGLSVNNFIEKIKNTLMDMYSNIRESISSFSGNSSNQKNTESQSTGNKVKNILLWILFGFFALTAFAFFPSFASFIALVVAVLVAPIEKWQNILNRYVKGKVKIFAVVILSIFTVAIAPTTDTTDDSVQRDTSISSSTNGTEDNSENISLIAPTTSTSSETTTTAATTETTTTTTATTTTTTETTSKKTTTTTTEEMVWIPTNGGSKYHSRAGCSNMDNPKQVKISKAKSMGFTPCKKCH